MILQRLTTAIRQQSWSQILTEILIVVIGIFLGLQVTDWNEKRQDRSDESMFLVRLHEDMLLMEDIPSRVVDRRMNLLTSLVAASDLVLGKSEIDQLTKKECFAIGDSHIVSMSIPGLPSLAELQNEGRLGILRDSELRLELITLQQRNQTFKELIIEVGLYQVNLSREFPALIPARPYFDEALKEYQISYQCDLKAMQSSAAFIGGLGMNIDAYDAYLRDGLIPWRAQAQKVHKLLDFALELNH